MYADVPSAVTLLISGLLFILNTIVCGGIITAGSLFRVLFRWQAAQTMNAKAMHAMYQLWAFNNRWIMNTFNAIEWKIDGVDNLSQKNSPFTYLLSPKAGGIAFTLAALDDEFDAILNVTLIYPDNKNVFWEMLNGHLKKVIVDIEIIPVSEVQSGDYFNDPVYRAHFQMWLNTQWQANDKLIANTFAAHGTESAKIADIDTIKHC